LKKFIKRVILALVIIASFYGVGRFIDVAYGSWEFVPRQPYMIMQTENSIRIKWQTPEEEIGSVHFGLTPKSLTNEIKDKEETKKHSLTLTGLKSCTRYFYSVDATSLQIDNQDRTFTTLCDKAQKQRIWVIGDSGEDGKNQQRVFMSMKHYINFDYNSLDMWLLLGDNAYSSGTQKQYNESLFDSYKSLVKRFVPWALLGNHDARRWAHYDIFDSPSKGESGGVPSHHKEYFAIDNGNLHLVILDSETVSRSKSGEMANWLRKDLAANKKPWVIVAFHTPPYSDGGHKSDSDWDSGGRLKEMRENFVPIFDEYGVDLVLNGHSHGYERSKLIKNHLGKSDTFSAANIVEDKKSHYTKSLTNKKDSGTIYQVCGSSAKLDGATLKHPAMPYSFHKMGSLILDITPTTLTSKFLTIDGDIADQFTITKEAK